MKESRHKNEVKIIRDLARSDDGTWQRHLPAQAPIRKWTKTKTNAHGLMENYHKKLCRTFEHRCAWSPCLYRKDWIIILKQQMMMAVKYPTKWMENKRQTRANFKMTSLKTYVLVTQQHAEGAMHELSRRWWTTVDYEDWRNDTWKLKNSECFMYCTRLSFVSC